MIKRKLFTFCLSLAFVGLGLVSCSKDSKTSNPVTSNPEVETAISNKVTCSYSGSLNGSFASYLSMNNGYENNFSLTGSSIDGKVVDLLIYGYSETPNSYSVSTSASTGASISFSTISASGAANYILTSGSVNITKITSKAIEGTFSGATSSDPSSANYLKITNGTFVCKR